MPTIYGHDWYIYINRNLITQSDMSCSLGLACLYILVCFPLLLWVFLRAPSQDACSSANMFVPPFVSCYGPCNSLHSIQMTSPNEIIFFNLFIDLCSYSSLHFQITSIYCVSLYLYWSDAVLVNALEFWLQNAGNLLLCSHLVDYPRGHFLPGRARASYKRWRHVFFLMGVQRVCCCVCIKN